MHDLSVGRSCSVSILFGGLPVMMCGMGDVPRLIGVLFNVVPLASHRGG